MNLQNVPFYLKEANLNLKDVFIPDSDLFDLYDLDIANAEMRMLCPYSQDETLINAFNSGLDIHCLTGSNPKVSKFSYEDILANKDNKQSEQYMVRQASKKINFGVIYVIGAHGLQVQLHNELKLDVSEQVCQDYIDGMLATYSGVPRYMAWVKTFVKNFGFMYSFTGRRKRFPIMEYTREGLNKMFRQAINFPIQATSSDLVLRNIVNLHKVVTQLGGRLLLTVHDSILFQLPKGTTGVKALLDRTIIEQTAKEFPWLPVPWKYDVGMGPSYGHCNGMVN